MRYQSTRGYGQEGYLTFSDILLEGLAPDGGLYVPSSYPQLARQDWVDLGRALDADGYAELCARIVALYADEIPLAELRAMAARAYTADKFGSDAIVPVSRLESGLWLAHLSNGPTAAFKDLAMQLLAQLFNRALAGHDRRLTILGATSGDTGSAAEVAMLDADRVQVFMLSPKDRMTPFQRGQMYGIDSPRVVNIVVPGTFDDCQDLVKAVNADADFKARYSIGAVNSINWARLVAQVVYYVASWWRVTGGAGPVSFTVPTGNFGNILAGHVARQMGLPIQYLVCATNENNVLAEFFASGVYRVRSSAETVATSSPSMDISKASNFERFLYDVDGCPDWIAHQFGQVLATTGRISIADQPWAADPAWRHGLVAGSSSHADRLATIADVWQTDHYLLDPHTADGVVLARRAAAGQVDGLDPAAAGPMIVTETALPVKFAQTINQAIGQPPPVPARFAEVETKPGKTIPLSGGVDQLKAVIEQHALV